MSAAERQVGLAAERLEHGLQVQAGVERAGGAGERGLVLGARAHAGAHVEGADRGGRLVGERVRQLHIVVAELPLHLRDAADHRAHAARRSASGTKNALSAS